MSVVFKATWHDETKRLSQHRSGHASMTFCLRDSGQNTLGDCFWPDVWCDVCSGGVSCGPAIWSEACCGDVVPEPGGLYGTSGGWAWYPTCILLYTWHYIWAVIWRITCSGAVGHEPGVWYATCSGAGMPGVSSRHGVWCSATERWEWCPSRKNTIGPVQSRWATAGIYNFLNHS